VPVCASLLKGKEAIEEAGTRLLEVITDVASGTLTGGEAIDDAAPIEVYGMEPLF
jgi:altronate dehydratase